MALLSAFALTAGCGHAHTPTLVGDFESGSLDGWHTEVDGAGGWFVYRDGHTPPVPRDTDLRTPFFIHDPPQGRHAAVTDANGPGRRTLARDLVARAGHALELTYYYDSAAPLEVTSATASPESLSQSYRIELVEPEEPRHVLATVFETTASSAQRCEPTRVQLDVSPWAGRTVRLLLTASDHRGPLRAAVDDVKLVEHAGPVVPGTACREREPTHPAPSARTGIESVRAERRTSEADAVRSLSDRVSALERDDEFAGAVLVARDGHVLLERAAGLADRAAGRPVAMDTQFRIGSMNKMFTSVAVLQLVDQGKLRLDAPLGTYLPAYPDRQTATEVTIRHLLTHTGGTGDIFGSEFDTHRLALREHQDYLRLYGSRSPRFPPGSRSEYSNYGFVLLGAVIEAVTGDSYDAYVRKHVFEPAAMVATGALPEAASLPRRAVAYTRSSGSWSPATDRLPWRGTAAGGGYSTVHDLLRFATALRTGHLLPAERVAELVTPHTQHYGYGFVVEGTGAALGFGHGGGAAGMNGELRIYPELGYVIVILSNLDPPAASRPFEHFTSRMPLTR